MMACFGFQFVLLTMQHQQNEVVSYTSFGKLFAEMPFWSRVAQWPTLPMQVERNHMLVYTFHPNDESRSSRDFHFFYRVPETSGSRFIVLVWMPTPASQKTDLLRVQLMETAQKSGSPQVLKMMAQRGGSCSKNSGLLQCRNYGVLGHFLSSSKHLDLENCSESCQELQLSTDDCEEDVKPLSSSLAWTRLNENALRPVPQWFSCLATQGVTHRMEHNKSMLDFCSKKYRGSYTVEPTYNGTSFKNVSNTTMSSRCTVNFCMCPKPLTALLPHAEFSVITIKYGYWVCVLKGKKNKMLEEKMPAALPHLSLCSAFCKARSCRIAHLACLSPFPLANVGERGAAKALCEGCAAQRQVFPSFSTQTPSSQTWPL